MPFIAMFSVCYPARGQRLASLRFFESFGMKTANNRVWKKAYLLKGWDAKLPVPVNRDGGAARLREPILPRGEWVF